MVFAQEDAGGSRAREVSLEGRTRAKWSRFFWATLVGRAPRPRARRGRRGPVFFVSSSARQSSSSSSASSSHGVLFFSPRRISSFSPQDDLRVVLFSFLFEEEIKRRMISRHPPPPSRRRHRACGGSFHFCFFSSTGTRRRREPRVAVCVVRRAHRFGIRLWPKLLSGVEVSSVHRLSALWGKRSISVSENAASPLRGRSIRDTLCCKGFKSEFFHTANGGSSLDRPKGLRFSVVWKKRVRLDQESCEKRNTLSLFPHQTTLTPLTGPQRHSRICVFRSFLGTPVRFK